MSLTLYFYKVKKGKTPNCRTKDWFVCRRMYSTYDVVSKHESTTDKNGWPVYPLVKEDMRKLRVILAGLNEFNAGDAAEMVGIKWLLKRKIDWEKYDIYVLNA